MALMPDGTVKGTGINDEGQLGDDSQNATSSWVTSNITGVASLSVVHHSSYYRGTIALMLDSSVKVVGIYTNALSETSWTTTSGVGPSVSVEPNGTIDSTAPISLINTGTISSIAVVESKPTGTDVKYALSFDGKTTWNVPSGVITDIATQGVDATTLATYNFTGFTGTTLDVGMYLSTTDTSVSPTVDQITVGMTLNGHYTQIVVDGDKLESIESGTHVVTITNGDAVSNTYKISIQ
jgi:hypothetical protein